jgi:hypothetical protein
MRNLMRFVQEAVIETEECPIPLCAAHLAIQQTVRNFSTSISEAHWRKLALLDASTDQRIANDDSDYTTN